MFETLKRLYESSRLNEAGLRKAVAEKGWITPEQFEQITGSAYEE
ncbi:XkdX family protein [Paenibacillus cymbidii]|nr:XkdX family protein [Paenibacillus cymbidii]